MKRDLGLRRSGWHARTRTDEPNRVYARERPPRAPMQALQRIQQAVGNRGMQQFLRRGAAGRSPQPRAIDTALPARIQRQLVFPYGQGGGYGGIMDRDRRRVERERAAAAARAAALASTPFHVCSRALALTSLFNHAYIEAPPFRYAIISPLCPSGILDNPITGTTAQKWDNSPDPCSKTPTCLPCFPKPGVTDVAACLRTAFTSYNALSLYRATGPNSNTFAGTLARACCSGMVPKPAALGSCPGWGDPPAAARAGGTPCPAGPVC